MAAENRSQLISKSSEQIVYFSAVWPVIKQTKNLEFRILIHIFYVFIQIFNVLINILTDLKISWVQIYSKLLKKNRTLNKFWFSIFLSGKNHCGYTKNFWADYSTKVVSKFHNHTESILFRFLCERPSLAWGPML